MVVISQQVLEQCIKTCKKQTQTQIPVINMKDPDAKSKLVKACEEFGFFKLINHGVSMEIVTKLEEEAIKFFSMTQRFKEKAGNPTPFGYGNKKIGQNGDVGWVEYLLMSAHPDFVSQFCLSIFPHNPHIFSNALKNYIKALKRTTSTVLELIAEGLKIEERKVLSRLVDHDQSDCYFRLNHYPPCSVAPEPTRKEKTTVGFGEHTDPQVISVLRSNNTGDLQICLKDGAWVSVPPDPSSFFFNVGDSLQVMTNGRFKSVKHRVIADYNKSRVSMIYFGGPPLTHNISPLPSIMHPGELSKYHDFTWFDYKKAAYKSRLSDCRLALFEKKFPY